VVREGVRGRGRGTVLDSKRFLPRPLSIFILSPRGCIARTDRLSTNLCDLGPRRDLPTRICGPFFQSHIILLRWGGLLLINASKINSDPPTSHLSHTFVRGCHCKAIVKVHGVLPSSRWYFASSRRIQFH